MSEETVLWSIKNLKNPLNDKVESKAINVIKCLDYIGNTILMPFNWILGTNYNNIIGGDLHELSDKGILRYIIDLGIKNPDKDIIYFRLANLNMCLINNVDLTKNICNRKMDEVKRGKVYERLTIFFGKGAFTTFDKNLWNIHRNEFYKMVTNRKLIEYTPIFYDKLVKTIDNIIGNNGEIYDLAVVLPQINLIAFCWTYFGIDVSSTANELILPLNRLLKYINNSIDPVFIPIGSQYLNFKKDIKIVHDYLENLMKICVESNIGDVDFIKIFKSDVMSTRELVEFMISIVLGGHEGTSRLLIGVLCSMARNKNIIDKLRNELKSSIYDIENNKVSYDIIKLSYLKYIVNEGCRLFPPVWICSREALVDLQIDDIMIKKGTQIFLSPLIIHRDEKIWGTTAEQFIPERYETLSGYRNNIYFPFLVGSENCTGEKLAILEASLFIVAIFSKYDIEIMNHEINPEAAGTFRITKTCPTKFIPLSYKN